jgi:hypothetical protein
VYLYHTLPAQLLMKHHPLLAVLVGCVPALNEL